MIDLHGLHVESSGDPGHGVRVELRKVHEAPGSGLLRVLIGVHAARASLRSIPGRACDDAERDEGARDQSASTWFWTKCRELPADSRQI